MEMQLNSQIEAMKLELKDKEKQLKLSGEVVNEMVQRNNDLNHELERLQESHLQEIEILRQENYSLQLKFDQEKLVQQSFANEIELTKEKVEQNVKQELARQENINNRKMSELRAEIESLHSELEKDALVNEQLRAKIAKQEELLAEAHRYSKKLKELSSLESQLEGVKEECSMKKFENDELKIVLDDINAEKEQVIFDRQCLKENVANLKKDLEETCSQGKIWFDSLQECRQHLSELQVENSILKAEAMNRSHKEKGNSLFGEVEDKRIEMEQKHNVLSEKYKSLSTTYQITKKQLIEMKTRILPMLAMAGNQADSSQIKRLEVALLQSKNEIQNLHVKIEELKKKSEVIENLKSKNSVLMMKLTGETDKRRQVESQLHSVEVEMEKFKLECVRLQIKNNEYSMKLKQLKEVGNQEKSPEITPLKSENVKPSLWKDKNLFAKLDDSKKKREFPQEGKILQPINASAVVEGKQQSAAITESSKFCHDDRNHSVLMTKSDSSLNFKFEKVVTTENDNNVPSEMNACKPADRKENIQTEEPSGNVLKELETVQNEVLKTVKPKRVIHVKKNASKNECQQQ